MSSPGFISKAYVHAFELLIQNAVCANFSEDITVLYDERFLQYLPSFISMVNSKKMSATYLFVPNSYQRVIQENTKFYVDGEIRLPRGIRKAISASKIVLNFLTGSTESSKVRGAVLNNINGNGCQIVHCPYLSDEILELIKSSDFDKVQTHCELVSWALGNSNSATLETKSPDGEGCQLSINLGDWDNEPFISGGQIVENSWGNALPGESFWCPYAADNTINGNVYINGSCPGFLLHEGDYLYLEFENGNITDYKANKNSAASKYLKKLLRETAALNDESWKNFAELGIGLNPAISSLTGNSLFDEKMAGTIHIAIGDNACFGHDIQSHIHHDLVIKNPTLILNQHKIIDNGIIDFSLIESWRKKYTPPELTLKDNTRILFQQTKIDIQPELIRRILNKGRRIGYVEVTQNKEIIHFLKTLFKNADDEIIFKDLKRELSNRLRLEDIKRFVETFVHYKMALVR